MTARQTYRHRAGVIVVLLAVSSVAPAAEKQPGASEKESSSIVGTWLIVGHTFCGEPSQDSLSAVRVFGTESLETYDATDQARFAYRLARPGSLEWSFAEGKFTPCGIYRFDGELLIWRIAHEEQPLSFELPPKGKWNEYRMKRLQGKEADEAISRMKAERLRQKAEQPDEE